MSGKLAGKVALISGAGRGQGRSHAVRLAAEGADIIAFDVCNQLATVRYPLASAEDLRETALEVESLGRRIIFDEVDVRDSEAISALVSRGVDEFGRLDIVCANAGILSWAANTWSITDEEWDETISVNLSGAWRTTRAAIPAMIAAGNGGSIVITGSTAALKGAARLAHYSAAKHGLLGLARSLAIELGAYSIRVNTVHPTGANTQMVVDKDTGEFYPGTTELASDDPATASKSNLLPVRLIEPSDVSSAIVWLCSDDGRYVTGAAIPVDAGLTQR